MAYRLKAKGLDVVLIDPKGIGGSGSHAAGAFLSPKVGKGGFLKEFTNQAYDRAISFYETFSSEIFSQAGLLHFPKGDHDAKENFDDFKRLADTKFTAPKDDDVNFLNETNLAKEGLFFKNGGIVDPIKLCETITKDIECMTKEVTQASFNGSMWDLDFCQAKKVVLATGAYNHPFDSDYIGLRAVWGERIEIKTSTYMPINYHQNISISQTKENGRITIGATHVQHLMEKELDDSHVSMLLDKASQIVKLEDINVVDHRGGVRSGTFDYLPIIGKLIDTKESLAKFPKLVKGTKVSQESLCYYPELFVINGSGGRGFVLAPYLSELLTDFMLDGKEIDVRLTTNRLFNRWVKKRHLGKPKEDI